VFLEGQLNTDILDEWVQGVVFELPIEVHVKTWKLQGIASYEGCRLVDNCPQDVRIDSDLKKLYSILRNWQRRWPKKSMNLNFNLTIVQDIQLAIPSTQPIATQSDSSAKPTRKTATQLQTEDLAERKAAEVAAGNYMDPIAEHWSCDVKGCLNYSKTCWRNLKPGAPENPAEHYPIAGDELRMWSREIKDGRSTVTEPSSRIVVALATFRERDRKKRNLLSLNQSVTEASGPSNKIDKLLDIMIIEKLDKMANSTTQQLPQLPIYQPSYPIYHLPYTPGSSTTLPQPAPPSSPIRSDTDSSKLLSSFFDWLVGQPGFGGHTKEVLLQIKDQLVEDLWDIDSLRERRLGEKGGLSTNVWEAYGWKVGLLSRIRGKISAFKQYRYSK
jgi:hypothetical protein